MTPINQIRKTDKGNPNIIPGAVTARIQRGPHGEIIADSQRRIGGGFANVNYDLCGIPAQPQANDLRG